MFRRKAIHGREQYERCDRQSEREKICDDCRPDDHREQIILDVGREHNVQKKSWNLLTDAESARTMMLTT